MYVRHCNICVGPLNFDINAFVRYALRPIERKGPLLLAWFSRGGVEFEYFPFGPFGFDPGFEQLLLTAAQSIFHIQKGQMGSL